MDHSLDTDRSEHLKATTLQLLMAIEQVEVVSQKSLATRLGIAVGLTNAYIRRAARRGWIKIKRVPARRFAYYLTPEGFVEKGQLAVEYLTSSFGFFRRARAQCVDVLQECRKQGFNRVTLYGLGELSEVMTLAARETPVELVGIVAEGTNQSEFAGLPLSPRLEDSAIFDAVVVTDIAGPQAAYERLCTQLEERRIFTIPLLHISRIPPKQ